MKTIAVLMAAALVGWATCGRATEPIAPPHDLPASDAPALTAPPAAFSSGPTADAGCASCGCGRRHVGLLEWLSYHPLHRIGPCECSGCCGGPLPPLYLYFLGHCSEHDCSTCGGGCAGCGCGWAGHAISGAPTGVGVIGH